MAAINEIVHYFNGQGIVIQVFFVILFTAIAYYAQTLVFRRLKSQAEKTKTNLDEAVVKALNKPLGILIWFLGISYSIDVMKVEANGAAIFHAVSPIRQLTVIIIIVWFLIRLIYQLEWAYTHPKDGKVKHIDTTTTSAIAKVLKIAVIITAVLVAIQTMGYPVSGILTLGSVGTLIAGFAAKDLLANFFGGLMIYFDRPFKIGDWIASPDRNIEGTVEHIGWRLSRIRTFDKRPLYVPNSVFSTISVVNPSRMQNRRIKTNVGVRYDDATKLAKIIAEVKKMLQDHPEIDPKATLIVNLVEFGPSSLNFMVYTFTKTTNWIKFQEIQQDVFLKIIGIIDKNGAECAFPTTTVHVPEGLKLVGKNSQQSVEEMAS